MQAWSPCTAETCGQEGEWQSLHVPSRAWPSGERTGTGHHHRPGTCESGGRLPDVPRAPGFGCVHLSTTGKERTESMNMESWSGGVWGTHSPHVFLHPTQLLEVKIAVEPVFPTRHFLLKQSCISSKPLNIYFKIPPII